MVSGLTCYASTSRADGVDCSGGGAKCEGVFQCRAMPTEHYKNTVRRSIEFSATEVCKTGTTHKKPTTGERSGETSLEVVASSEEKTACEASWQKGPHTSTANKEEATITTTCCFTENI